MKMKSFDFFKDNEKINLFEILNLKSVKLALI